MSDLRKINEEFERAIHEQIEQRLEMREGQLVVVRKFPPLQKIFKHTIDRNEMVRTAPKKDGHNFKR